MSDLDPAVVMAEHVKEAGECSGCRNDCMYCEGDHPWPCDAYRSADLAKNQHDALAALGSSLVQITNAYHRLTGLPDELDDQDVYETIAARLAEYDGLSSENVTLQRMCADRDRLVAENITLRAALADAQVVEAEVICDCDATYAHHFQEGCDGWENADNARVSNVTDTIWSGVHVDCNESRMHAHSGAWIAVCRCDPYESGEHEHQCPIYQLTYPLPKDHHA